MEDLTPEQIIQIGQKFFPELDAQKIMEIFEQYKAKLPKDMSNLDIVKVIKLNIDEYQKSKGKPQFSNLKDAMKTR